MVFVTLENVDKVASKLKIKNRTKRIAVAKEINELAKFLIEWREIDNEKSNSIH